MKFAIASTGRNTENARGEVRIQCQLIGKDGKVVKGNISRSMVFSDLTVSEAIQGVATLANTDETDESADDTSDETVDETAEVEA